jgi:hypothetical protein
MYERLSREDTSLAQKKSSVEAESSNKFFLIDDLFNWIYCSAYPNCYGRLDKAEAKRAEIKKNDDQKIAEKK